mmetsp:Transcript_40985/g.130237  ORF Transcript_40985/g.130237 Transcript_40985/m.130237 type:complete len:216 (+) Transcript_40985:122-769(+)
MEVAIQHRLHRRALGHGGRERRRGCVGVHELLGAEDLAALGVLQPHVLDVMGLHRIHNMGNRHLHCLTGHLDLRQVLLWGPLVIEDGILGLLRLQFLCQGLQAAEPHPGRCLGRGGARSKQGRGQQRTLAWELRALRLGLKRHAAPHGRGDPEHPTSVEEARRREAQRAQQHGSPERRTRTAGRAPRHALAAAGPEIGPRHGGFLGQTGPQVYLP